MTRKTPSCAFLPGAQQVGECCPNYPQSVKTQYEIRFNVLLKVVYPSGLVESVYPFLSKNIKKQHLQSLSFSRVV